MGGTDRLGEKTMKQWAAIFLTGAAICGAGWYYYSTNTVEAMFLAACEEAMKGRLKSPSTYKRIDYSFSYSPMKTEAYVSAMFKEAYDLDDSLSTYASLRDMYYRQIEQARSGSIKPYEVSGRIEFDAANSYGAPIRNSFMCSHIQHEKNSKKLYASDMKIDGMTNLELSINQLKKANGGS